MSFARKVLVIRELFDSAIESRAKALVVGDIQSVGRIGSQTANTVTFASGCCSSSLSNAEDPQADGSGRREQQDDADAVG